MPAASPIPALCSPSNRGAIPRGAGFWILAAESAACNSGGAAAPFFMQGFADAFRRAGDEVFPLPHFRAIPGIFREAPVHLMDA